MSNRNAFDILLNLAEILARKKKIVILGTLIPTIICIVTVLVVHSEYESTALVNPPQSEGSSPLKALAGLSGMGDAVGSLLGGSETGLDDCISLLESTHFATLVINHFDLETRYKFKTPGKKQKKYHFVDVLKHFHRQVDYEVTDENAIRLSAKDRSPEQAKEMVDYMVFLLDSLYTDIQQVAIKHRLAYVDKRLAMTLIETRVLEDSMIQFQNKNNLFVPEAQLKIILENTTRTELRLETLKEEMALEASLRGTTSDKYRDLQSQKRLQEETLNSRLRNKTDSNSLILPTHSLPALVTEYFRLERAYTVRLGVYKYLVQQVELLKLDANKNVQVISMLDQAWVNNKRVSPKRRVMVQLVFILSLLISTVSAILLSVWERHKSEDPGIQRRLSNLRSSLFRL